MIVLEVAGGADKGHDGHRRDTVPICNELIARGWEAQPRFYCDAEYETLLAEMSSSQVCAAGSWCVCLRHRHSPTLEAYLSFALMTQADMFSSQLRMADIIWQVTMSSRTSTQNGM